MNWSCPLCGHNEKVYDFERNVWKCGLCGHEEIDQAKLQEEINYKRDLDKAKEYLMVHEYAKSMNTIRPYIDRYPTRKAPYLIMLACLTKDYTDFLFTDSSARNTAAIYWDKLKALQGINGVMADYARRRKREIESRRSKSAVSLIIWYTVFVSCLLLSISAEKGFLIFLSIAALVIYTYKNIVDDRFVKAMRRAQNKNPFDL